MGNTVVTALLVLPGVSAATLGNATVGRALREALAAASGKPAELCFVAAAWDAARGLRVFGTLDEVNTEGNDDGAVAAAEGAMDALRIPSSSQSPAAGRGRRRRRAQAAAFPTPSPSPPPRLSTAALRAALGAPGALPTRGALVELNVVALVVGTVSDPAAQAVAVKVGAAFAAPDAAATLLAPALVAAGEAQGGPPGAPAPGGAALVAGSVGVQLIPRLAIAPSPKRRSLWVVLAPWALAAIVVGSVLACLIAAAAWLRRRACQSKRAATAVAPLPIQREVLKGGYKGASWRAPPLAEQPRHPTPPSADTTAASEPRPTLATHSWGGEAATAAELEEEEEEEEKVERRPPPPRAAPPPLPGAPADAVDAHVTNETLRLQERAQRVLDKTRDRGAAFIAKPREQAALKQGLILRAGSDRVWWSSPHAPKAKAAAKEKGFGPIDKERLAYEKQGKKWPPPPPRPVELSSEELEALGGAAAAEDALRHAALMARSTALLARGRSRSP